MKPFRQINIGDIYENPSKWAGINTTYEVVSKDNDSRMIEVQPSYQHLLLPKTLWKKDTDKLFSQRVISNAEKQLKQ